MIRFSINKLGAVSALAILSATAANAAEVSLFCSSSGLEYELCSEAANTWASETGNTVKINKMPAAWDEALPLYQQLLAAKSSDIDVMVLDVIWVGLLKEHLLDLQTALPAEAIEQHFASVVDAGTVDGKLVGMPWYTDTGLLFYRTDLLEKYGKGVPETWAELTATAAEIQDAERAAGNADMWGYVWQGKAYEGLTCDGIEWVASYDGGHIVEPDGSISINNEGALAALTEAAGWVDTISPKGVLGYDEEGSRGVFETGNAVFHRNWSYVWGTSQSDGSDLKGKVGVTSLPAGQAGGSSAGCMGSAHLGVSAYTAHPEEAADLLNYLTGAAEQKRRAIAGAYNPTVTALYEDPDVLQAIPFLPDAKAAFDQSASRPSSVTLGDYNKVSSAFYTTVHGVLSGESDPQAALEQLASDIERIKSRGDW